MGETTLWYPREINTSGASLMVLTCPHCGANVSDPNSTCPQCGLPVSEAPSPLGDAARGKKSSAYAPLLPVLVGALLIATVVAVVWSIDRHMTKTAANVMVPATRDAQTDEGRFNESMRRATLGNIVLRQAQLYPDSYKLDKATLMEDGAICYLYHVRKESGEMTAETAVLTPQGRVAIGDLLTTQAAWEESCSAQAGTDVTQRIGR
jgi:hypothetical protein